MAQRVSFSKTYPLGQTGLNNFGAQISNILFTMFNFEYFLCPRLLSEGAKISNSNEISSKFSRGRLAAPPRVVTPLILLWILIVGWAGVSARRAEKFSRPKTYPLAKSKKKHWSRSLVFQSFSVLVKKYIEGEGIK
mgnify:CR=1 FL=1